MANLELGPCQALFGTAGAETNLGKTEGGVTARFFTDFADLMTDQDGTRPQDRIITGQGAEIELALADILLENIALALNQTLFISGGTHLVVGENRIGASLKDTFSGSLLLKKYVGGAVSTDEDDWLRFPKAAPNPETVEIVFDKATQRVINATFIAFFDDNDSLYYFGNEATPWS